MLGVIAVETNEFNRIPRREQRFGKNSMPLRHALSLEGFVPTVLKAHLTSSLFHDVPELFSNVLDLYFSERRRVDKRLHLVTFLICGTSHAFFF